MAPLVILLDLKILSHYAVDEVYLTEISSSHFGEEDAKKVYLDFREELGKVISISKEQNVNFVVFCVCLLQPYCNFILCQVEDAIEKRNEKLVAEGKIPYTVLLPSKIPAGIAV